MDRSKLKVYEKRCNECLFSDNRIVDEQRKENVIDGCIKVQTHFICHKSTIEDDGNVCCRGFWDLYKDKVIKLILADKWNFVEFIPLPKPKN